MSFLRDWTGLFAVGNGVIGVFLRRLHTTDKDVERDQMPAAISRHSDNLLTSRWNGAATLNVLGAAPITGRRRAVVLLWVRFGPSLT